MLFDHLGLDIADLVRSRTFYDRALAPLQIAVLWEESEEHGSALGYGKTKESGDVQAGKPSFWIATGKPGGHTHVAFLANERSEVDAFYKGGLTAGGKDNGPPGPRLQYHPNYYAAFVLDPDGHNIEVVCHKPG